jgi:hypothetical protein
MGDGTRLIIDENGSTAVVGTGQTNARPGRRARRAGRSSARRPTTNGDSQRSRTHLRFDLEVWRAVSGNVCQTDRRNERPAQLRPAGAPCSVLTSEAAQRGR